jgi:cobalt-zinc-cadmium efflux system protein
MSSSEELACQGHAPHAHGHDHGHGVDAARPLRTAFAITAGVLVLEAVGGLLTGSVALLADAGHMLTDAGALAIALFAAWAATQPRLPRHSFGYGRAEILAALLNGLLLGGVSVGVAIESFSRLADARPVAAGPMMAIAAIGLAANVASGTLLLRGSHENLNVRAALYHVVGDALGSVAALVAGAAIWLFDFTRADALAGLAIAVLLVASAVRLLRESVEILPKGRPATWTWKRSRASPPCPGSRGSRPAHLDGRLRLPGDERPRRPSPRRRSRGRAAGRAPAPARALRHRPHHHPDRIGPAATAARNAPAIMPPPREPRTKSRGECRRKTWSPSAARSRRSSAAGATS